MNRLRLYFSIFATITALGTIAYCFGEDLLRGYIFAEDMLVESATATLFLMTFILGLCVFPRAKNKIPIAVVLGFALFGFLDEISFGERLLGLKMPHWGDAKIDAVHDLIDIGILLVAPYYAVVSLAILAAALVATVIIVSYRNTLFRMLCQNQAYVFGSIFFILAFVALLIDVRHVKRLEFLEELCELNAAIALFFFAMCLKRPKDLFQFWPTAPVSVRGISETGSPSLRIHTGPVRTPLG